MSIFRPRACILDPEKIKFGIESLGAEGENRARNPAAFFIDPAKLQAAAGVPAGP
jgi:hypothetical protein